MDTSVNNIAPVKQRDYWFDNAKAILIFTVVLGHLAEILLSVVPYTTEPQWLRVLYNTIYVFHMPVFMIISGRFAKRKVESNDFVSVINGIFVPYLICQTCMLLFNSTVNYESTSNFSYLRPYYGLWYLLAIGIYQVVTPHVLKITRLKWLLLPLSLVIAILFSFQEKAFYGNFQRFFNYFPFFIFGYLTSGYKLEFCKKIIFRILSFAVFVLVVYAVMQNPDMFQVRLLSGKRVYNQVIEFLDITELNFFIFLLLRYALGFLFFFIILGLSPAKKTLFSHIGTNSTYVYILHLFIAVALTAYAKEYDSLDFCKNELYTLMVCLSSVPLCFLLVSPPVKKLTGWMIAPKFDLKKVIERITNK